MSSYILEYNKIINKYANLGHIIEQKYIDAVNNQKYDLMEDIKLDLEKDFILWQNGVVKSLMKNSLYDLTLTFYEYLKDKNETNENNIKMLLKIS